MINEGLDLLNSYFIKNKPAAPANMGNGYIPADNEDLCPLELFYSSTKSSIISSEIDQEKKKNQTSKIDVGYVFKDSGSFEIDNSEEKKVKAKRMSIERDLAEHRKCLKIYIDNNLVTGQETQALGRFLHNHLREEKTLEKIKQAEIEVQMSQKKIYYVSPAFFTDVLTTTSAGITKRKFISNLRIRYFNEYAVSRPSTINWASSDFFKGVESTMFEPFAVCAVYEDAFQRLFLHQSCRLNTHTQRVNPRCSIVAYMSMMVPTYDNIIELDGVAAPTTVRGMMENILDGNLYKGYTIVNLTKPVRLLESGGSDIEEFCNRALECSFYAIFLTFCNLIPWIPERYPDDNFLQLNTFKTIKLNKREVIFDRKDGVWIFIHKNNMVYTHDFWTLIAHFYN